MSKDMRNHPLIAATAVLAFAAAASVALAQTTAPLDTTYNLKAAAAELQGPERGE